MHVLGLPPAFVLSQDQTLKLKALRLSLTSNLAHRLQINPKIDLVTSLLVVLTCVKPPNSEADTWIIGPKPYQADMLVFASNFDRTARISLQISINVKKQRKQNNLNRAISLVAPCKPSSSEFSRSVQRSRLPPRPVRPFRRLGEAVFTETNWNPQAEKTEDAHLSCKSLILHDNL